MAQNLEPEFIDPPTFAGTQQVTVGNRTFGVPAESIVRYANRLGLVFVLLDGRIHALSEHGEVRLTTEQELHMAKAFQAEAMATGENMFKRGEPDHRDDPPVKLWGKRPRPIT